MGLYLTCVYITFILICVVVSVIIVACSLFLSMCLFLLVNCLLNAFAICMGEVTVLSVRVIVLLL